MRLRRSQLTCPIALLAALLVTSAAGAAPGKSKSGASTTKTADAKKADKVTKAEGTKPTPDAPTDAAGSSGAVQVALVDPSLTGTSASTATTTNAALSTDPNATASTSDPTASSAGPTSTTTAATAPAANTPAPAGAVDPEADQTSSASFALQQMGLTQKRWWQVGASIEAHRLLRQDDLGGAGRNKAFNYLNIYAGVRPTAKSQIRVTGGAYQRFLADGGETGIRADDITIAANYLFQLPADLALRPQIANDIPISFESRLASLYAVPRASLLLMRNFFDGNLNLMLRGSGAVYISEYKTAVGMGSANPIGSAGVSLGVNYSMPFHQNLQLGGSIQSTWQWLHEVEHLNDPNLQSQFKNTPIEASGDPTFRSQPVGQTYGGEVYIGYQLPTLMGAQSNLQLALSQGTNSVNHDGRSNVYWLFRRSGQVYLALQVQY